MPVAALRSRGGPSESAGTSANGAFQIQCILQLSARTQSSLQGRNMSGHSKWATTKYRKGAQDKARAKIFAKLIRQVEVAAREGGGDMEANATLRTMYHKARASSVPLDTIEKA